MTSRGNFLFATNLALNEVDVLTGSSLSVQERIPIAQPFGIDQMPDGNTLVVGTFTQGFYTIDENTLAVKHYLAPNFTQQVSTVVLLIPVAMANGNVLFMGKDFGVASGDIFIYGGQAIVEWNSSSGQFSMPFYVSDLSFEIDNLKRSADHNWAVYAADKLYIYSSATIASSLRLVLSAALPLAFETSRQIQTGHSSQLYQRNRYLFTIARSTRLELQAWLQLLAYFLSTTTRSTVPTAACFIGNYRRPGQS